MTDDTKKQNTDAGCESKGHDTGKMSAAVAKYGDPVQNALGDFGWWQFWITFALSLLKFPIAWHQLAIIFLAARTPFQCDVDNGTALLNGTDSKCSSRDPLTNDIVPCQQFAYDRSVFRETIITEVCVTPERTKSAIRIRKLPVCVPTTVDYPDNSTILSKFDNSAFR